MTPDSTFTSCPCAPSSLWIGSGSPPDLMHLQIPRSTFELLSASTHPAHAKPHHSTVQAMQPRDSQQGTICPTRCGPTLLFPATSLQPLTQCPCTRPHGSGTLPARTLRRIPSEADRLLTRHSARTYLEERLCFRSSSSSILRELRPQNQMAVRALTL